MRYLGIDVGKARVGVAISDESGAIAFPLEVIPRKGCADHLRALAAERSVESIVFGESHDLDGTENKIMHDIRSLAKELADTATILFEPEQFSTQAAARLGKGTDAEAAALILQSYLDRVSKNRGA